MFLGGHLVPARPEIITTKRTSLTIEYGINGFGACGFWQQQLPEMTVCSGCFKTQPGILAVGVVWAFSGAVFFLDAAREFSQKANFSSQNTRSGVQGLLGKLAVYSNQQI